LLSPTQWGSLGTVNVQPDQSTKWIMIAAAAGLGIIALSGFMRAK